MSTLCHESPLVVSYIIYGNALAEGAARARAREADDALARGKIWGLLHGIPITIKDGWETEGIISTGGTSSRMSFIPAQDVTVVMRLRSAGAVILGKANVPELSVTNETGNAVYEEQITPTIYRASLGTVAVAKRRLSLLEL